MATYPGRYQVQTYVCGYGTMCAQVYSINLSTSFPRYLPRDLRYLGM